MESKTSALDDPARLGRLSWDDRGGILRELAAERLRKEFASYQPKHEPSPKAWTALRALLSCMEEAVNGRLEPKVYLSSLDCGVGKSSAVVAFIDKLLSFPEYASVGVLVCVSRLEEIRAFVKRAGIPDTHFAVFTADANDDLNSLGLGKDRATEAQILFTTHAMTERLCKGNSFADIEALKFDGKPRMLRIWDEALSFGRGLSISVRDISALERRFSAFQSTCTAIEKLVAELRASPDGALYEIPDLEETGVSINDLARILADHEEDRRIAMALWSLSGKLTTVRKDGIYGNSAIDYEETLPADIKPIICLDASGRVRSSYSAWEKSRGDLIRLPTAPKDYSPLTCGVWRTSGSKSAFVKNERELCEGVANAINERHGRNILVVIHKPKVGRFDVEKSVRALVKGDQDRVRFITWGNHTASNEYANCSTTILAGTLFYRASMIEGIARAAMGLSSSQGKIPHEELKEIELGEARHNILQAAARGSMRRSVGDKCAPCELLLIASATSGIAKALPDIFPGCRVEPWQPIVRKPQGIVKAVIDYVREWAGFALEGDFLPFKEVQSKIGIANAKDFLRTIREDEDVRDTVSELGLSEGPRKLGGKYAQGWRMIDFAKHFEDETKPSPAARAQAEARGDF
jgi:hypothetical protein